VAVTAGAWAHGTPVRDMRDRSTGVA
jgi:hypothetical protein